MGIVAVLAWALIQRVETEDITAVGKIVVAGGEVVVKGLAAVHGGGRGSEQTDTDRGEPGQPGEPDAAAGGAAAPESRSKQRSGRHAAEGAATPAVPPSPPTQS